jgi:two-component system chemotaxis response regulator CheY
MRALLNHALASSGFEVFQADDGQAALEWLVVNEVDVVITDINMPRLDGFGLIERLRGQPPRDRPILVLTTESSPEKKRAPAPPGRPGGSSSRSIPTSWSPPSAASPTDPASRSSNPMHRELITFEVQGQVFGARHHGDPRNPRLDAHHAPAAGPQPMSRGWSTCAAPCCR